MSGSRRAKWVWDGGERERERGERRERRQKSCRRASSSSNHPPPPTQPIHSLCFLIPLQTLPKFPPLFPFLYYCINPYASPHFIFFYPKTNMYPSPKSRACSSLFPPLSIIIVYKRTHHSKHHQACPFLHYHTSLNSFTSPHLPTQAPSLSFYFCPNPNFISCTRLNPVVVGSIFFFPSQWCHLFFNVLLIGWFAVFPHLSFEIGN